MNPTPTFTPDESTLMYTLGQRGKQALPDLLRDLRWNDKRFEAAKRRPASEGWLRRDVENEVVFYGLTDKGQRALAAYHGQFGRR